jgi:uncharacterized protein YutE (UPF0331/DUF86 family)
MDPDIVKAKLDFDVPSPESMSGVFAALGKAGVLSVPLAERMSKAAGFRNIAVHDYASIDWSIVFSIVTTRLGDFRAFAEALLRRLEPSLEPPRRVSMNAPKDT